MEYLCPCNLCKGGKYYTRRYINMHLATYGRFAETLENFSNSNQSQSSVSTASSAAAIMAPEMEESTDDVDMDDVSNHGR